MTKAYKTGDGATFQFFLSSGILTAGMLYNIALCFLLSDGCPRFEPLAMLGGAIWCVGNSFVVSIVKTIGLGMGLLIWGLSNMVMGWATGYFGLFGLSKASISNPTLNLVGVAVAVAAMGVFSQVKPSLDEGKAPKKAKGLGEDGEALLGEEEGGAVNAGGEGAAAGGAAAAADDADWTDSLTDGQKKLYGVAASLVSGVCYGLNFAPPQYVSQHLGNFPGAPTDLKDYVFAHFTGIWLTSLAYMLVYLVRKAAAGARPQIFVEAIAPAWLSGMIWSSAQISWFFANQYLSTVVAFPIIAIGPGMVGAAWGVFVFKEIQGKRNFYFLGAAFFAVAIAVSLIVVSTM